MTDADKQLAAHFATFEPNIARLGKALRTKLRARLPGLSEVVYLYEGRGSLVISYSASGRGYDAVCTLAVERDRVKLFFPRSPQLSKADANGLLQGSAKTVRYVPMQKAGDLARADIEALIEAALERAAVRPVPGAKGTMIHKAAEQRERAARGKKAAASTPSRGAARTKR